MYRFFQVVDRAKIEQNHLAGLMGVHPSAFSAVKVGRRRPNHAFMAGAVTALKQIGIRQDDGTPYTVDDLFFDPVDNTISTSDKTLTTVAAD